MAAIILPYIFSMVDFASIFIFIVCIFNLPLKNRSTVIKIVASTAVLAIVSHFIIYLDYQKYSLWILIPSVVLIMRFVFKQNKTYSIWISVTGYIFVLSIQLLIIYGLLFTKAIAPEDATPYTYSAYLIQLATFMIICMISYIVHKLGDAMTFDFDNLFGQKINFKSPVRYIVTSIAILLFISLTFPNFYGEDLDMNFYISITSSLLCFFILIVMSLQRNKEENERNRHNT